MFKFDWSRCDAKIGLIFMIGVVILISISLGASADIDTNIIIRVFYIFLASIYGLCAMSIIAPIVNPDG